MSSGDVHMSLIEKVIEKAAKSAAQGRVDLGTDSPSGEQAAIARPSSEVVDPASLKRKVVAGDPLNKNRSQHVELDTVMMAAKGLILPETGYTRIAEEYRRIKHPLLRRAFGEGPPKNVIMVTSSVPNEGKTFSAINLAISIAMELDRTTLLIDLDIAKNGVSAALGLDPSRGVVDVLVSHGDISLHEVMLKTNIPKLSVLPAGTKDFNISELYSSRTMVEMMRELATRFSDRVIIIDAPPMVSTSEARVLIDLVDQVVFVVEAEKTSKHLVEETLAQIDKAKLAGVLLNKTNQRVVADSYYGSYGYRETAEHSSA